MGIGQEDKEDKDKNSDKQTKVDKCYLGPRQMVRTECSLGRKVFKGKRDE